MAAFRTLATVRHHGMVLTDCEFEAPLDHDRPSEEKLSLFARAVTSAAKAGADRPWLLFLQGGPGFPGPRPLANSGWLKRALADYRVLLLDSRGNGRSSVVLAQTLARRGNARAQADYLMHFRADSIVRDAELPAQEERWPALYDPAQLGRNTVPCVAAVYAEDMYVPRGLSEQTAARIAGCRVWLTNEHEHSGLRASDRVFDRLVAVMRDEA